MAKTALELRTEYEEYLDTLGAPALRSLGREIGVSQQTRGKTKADLIDLIIGILMGDIDPTPKSNRGAPVKSEAVNPKILLRLHEIGGKTAENVLRQVESQNFPQNILTVNASKPKEGETFMDSIYVGQVVKQRGIAGVYPLDGCQPEEQVLIEQELFDAYTLKEGDVVSYSVKKKEMYSKVAQIFKINDLYVSDFQRRDFSSTEISYYNQRIPFPNNKYVSWFFPIYQGKRTLVVSPAKAGKTTFLKGVCEEMVANKAYKTFALLLEQPNETFYRFRSILPERNLLATTYENEAEEHVFLADFMLNRAKAYAETGKDVVLVIDGLLALAKAYDECNSDEEKMLSSSLSAKSLRYVKKYLASARDFVGKGSLTLICSLSVKTGNPEDDLFFAELSPVFETRISFDEELARKQIYPSINFEESYAEDVSVSGIKKGVRIGKEELIKTVNESENYQDFTKKINAR